MKKRKELGQVFSSSDIAENILDSVGYKGVQILNKKIIDPSCGDGSLLYEATERVIDICKKNKLNPLDYLENCIYGIEIDKNQIDICIRSLNSLVAHKTLIDRPIQWNIYNNDALKTFENYKKKFDYVVGNPPYVRAANINSEVRKNIKETFRLSHGIIDLFVVFFEIGFELLSEQGRLCYITPNRYLYNKSFTELRKFLKEKRAVESIINFKDSQQFHGFSINTAITVIDFNQKKDTLQYKEKMTDDFKTIKYKDLDDSKWIFDNEYKLFFSSNMNKKTLSDYYKIQYGISTNRDDIYIGNMVEDDDLVLFNGSWIEKNLLRKVIKGSTYKGDPSDYQYLIFPYVKENGDLHAIPESELKDKYNKTYRYLLKYRNVLEARDMMEENIWYEFGRNQGLKNMHKNKVIVSILNLDKINFHKVASEFCVYSCVFATETKASGFEMLEEVLGSDYFYKYVMMYGKDHLGGYKALTAKMISEFPVKKGKNESKISL